MAPALDGERPPRWLWVVLVLLLAAVGAWGLAWSLGRPAGISGAGPVPEAGWEVPPFLLVDQDGRPFGRGDLAGRPWVAGFIFTRCTTLCPRVVERMARIQKTTPVALVCFSVDPENDTPEALKAYAKAHGARPERWRFLTGDRTAIHDLVSRGFRLSVALNPGADPGDAVTHSDRLALVDGRGRVLGTFSCGDPESYGRLLDALAGVK